MAKAIKDNKCLVPVEYLRGTWMFNVAAGTTETESFPLTGNYPDNPVVMVSANTDTYSSDVVAFGYVDEDNAQIVVGVTNNSAVVVDGYNVNFVVI